MNDEDGNKASPRTEPPSSPPPDSPGPPVPSANAASPGADLPLLTRLIMLVYALAWFGVLLCGTAFATYGLPATASWLIPLLLMAPVITRAWFSPVRLREAVFFKGWRGMGLSALEGLAASALLPLWFYGVFLLIRAFPERAKEFAVLPEITSWPDLVAGLAAGAIGEELFFRGFLQHEISLALQDRPRLGARMLGRGWLVASALFGVAHVITQMQSGLLTFFPGLLFGFLYARRQQIIGPAIFHFGCNLGLIITLILAGLTTPAPAPSVGP